MPRRRTYRVAVAQLGVGSDRRLDLCGVLEAPDVAHAEEADFLLAPEMALTGYHGDLDKALRDELVAELRAACAGRRVAFSPCCRVGRGV